MKHVFILNPAAGKSDQTPRYAQDIDRICGKRGLDYEICVSKAPGDCRALARKPVKRGRRCGCMPAAATARSMRSSAAW